MDSNISKLLYAPVTWGAFDSLPGGATVALKEIPFLGSQIIAPKMTVMSEAIRSDRARSELVPVGRQAQGPANFEFLVGPYNDFILGALRASDWVSGTDSVTAGAATLGNLIVATVGTFSANAQGARYVKISGFANPGNNGIKRVVAMSDTVLAVDSVAANESDEEITVEFQYARNGVAKPAFLIEHQYLGLATPNYHVFTGMAVNTWNISVEARARILQRFEFIGAQGHEKNSTFGTDDPVAPSQRRICNTTGNIGALVWDGGAMPANVLSMTFNMDNNLRERPAVSRETTLTQGSGWAAPDGQLNTYFDNPDLYKAFQDHESASLLMPITDPDGNLLSIHLPKLQFPAGSPTIQGVNSDIMVPLDFNAVIHNSFGYVIQVDQLDAPAAS